MKISCSIVLKYSLRAKRIIPLALLVLIRTLIHNPCLHRPCIITFSNVLDFHKYCSLAQLRLVYSHNNEQDVKNFVKETLALRWLSTWELLKLIHYTVDDQMERIKDIGQVLHEDLSMEGIIHMRYYAIIVLN